jgi:uncharacterized repeat protein (TIGR03803 family)
MRTMQFIVAACCIAAATSCGNAGSPPASMPSTGGRIATQSTGTFETLYTFTGKADGALPAAALEIAGGKIYGTTQFGGTGYRTCDCGVVFSVDGQGHETVLHAFIGTNKSKHQTDGAEPLGGLTPFKGKLYGTTSSGGDADQHQTCGSNNTSGCGVVYSIDSSGNERTVYRFHGSHKGYSPIDNLVEFHGKLYGVTGEGGECELCGTVFSIDASGHQTVVHRFEGRDGSTPEAGLSLIDGKLYGTTLEGGTCCGTVYSIDASNHFTTVYNFTGGADGLPISTLVQIGGVIYGTAESDGTNCGTIFAIDAQHNGKTVWTFCHSPTDGNYPTGHLAVAHGVLYGTTTAGGGTPCHFHRGCGTVFAFDPKTGTEQIVHAFTSDEGKAPVGVVASGGALYGVTFYSGSGRGAGSVYRLTL